MRHIPIAQCDLLGETVVADALVIGNILILNHIAPGKPFKNSRFTIHVVDQWLDGGSSCVAIDFKEHHDE